LRTTGLVAFGLYSTSVCASGR